MSFLKKHGGLKKISHAKKHNISTRDMTLKAIEDQRKKLISLSTPYTQIPTKSRSRWFKDYGMFIPYVSMYRFFGEDYISYEKGNEISVLNDLETAVRSGDGEIQKYIAAIDKKRKGPKGPRNATGMRKELRKKY